MRRLTHFFSYSHDPTAIPLDRRSALESMSSKGVARKSPSVRRRRHLCAPSNRVCPERPLPLSDDWQTIEVPWFLVQPRNLPFDTRDLLGVQFQAYDWAFPASAPINFDFCVDDIELF
jgi:hypothetical protein